MKLQEKDILYEMMTIEARDEKGEMVKYEVNKALSARFIMASLAILNTRAAKNWLRIDTFLDVIHYFAIGRNDAIGKNDNKMSEEDIKAFKEQESIGLEFLLKQKFVEKACDFVLGKKSPLCNLNEKRPEMGGSYSNPNFSALIKIMTRVITDENLMERFPMSELEKKMFLQHDLLKVMLGSSQGSKQFGKCLANMCRDNFKLSKKVGKVFIRSIDNSNYDTVKNYLTALKPYLRMEDSLKDIKLEWIFGFSQVGAKKGYREERFKYGVETINNINEEVNTYTSPIATGPVDDALFS